jgi:hypothetical protein
MLKKEEKKNHGRRRTFFGRIHESSWLTLGNKRKERLREREREREIGMEN